MISIWYSVLPSLVRRRVNIDLPDESVPLAQQPAASIVLYGQLCAEDHFNTRDPHAIEWPLRFELCDAPDAGLGVVVEINCEWVPQFIVGRAQ